MQSLNSVACNMLLSTTYHPHFFLPLQNCLEMDKYLKTKCGRLESQIPDIQVRHKVNDVNVFFFQNFTLIDQILFDLWRSSQILFILENKELEPRHKSFITLPSVYLKYCTMNHQIANFLTFCLYPPSYFCSHTLCIF